jgi:hypothetical protein
MKARVTRQVSAAQLSAAHLSANNSAPPQLSATSTERQDNSAPLQLSAVTTERQRQLSAIFCCSNVFNSAPRQLSAD